MEREHVTNLKPGSTSVYKIVTSFTIQHHGLVIDFQRQEVLQPSFLDKYNLESQIVSNFFPPKVSPNSTTITNQTFMT